MLSSAALHSPLPLVQGLRPGETTLADLSPPTAQGWGTPGLLPKVLRGPGTATPTGQGPPALGHLRSSCLAPGPCPQPLLQAGLCFPFRCLSSPGCPPRFSVPAAPARGFHLRGLQRKGKAQLFNWPKTENGGLPSPYSETCRLYSFVKKWSLPACDYVYFFRSEMKYFSMSHLQNKDFSFPPWMFPPKLRVRQIHRNFQLKLVDFEYQRWEQ